MRQGFFLVEMLPTAKTIRNKMRRAGGGPGCAAAPGESSHDHGCGWRDPDSSAKVHPAAAAGAGLAKASPS